MPRTNNEEVERRISVPSDLDLSAFVADASIIVDGIAGFPEESPLTAAELKAIETWVTCHLIAAQSPRASSLSDTGRSRSFGSPGFDGFKTTAYGQRALLLDRSNRLVTQGQSAQTASISFISNYDPDDI